MAKSQGPITKHGHVLHPNNVQDECFYCGKPAPSTYDYVPPKEVTQDDELRAMMLEPAYAISACPKCKSDLYLHRFRLSTVGQRKAFLSSKSKDKVPKDKVRREFEMSLVKPWQRAVVNRSTGETVIVDLPDFELSEEVIAMRDAHFLEGQGEKRDVAPKNIIGDFG